MENPNENIAAPTTRPNTCSLCNLSIYLADWVIGSEGKPAHSRPVTCIRLLKKEVAEQKGLIDSLTLDLAIANRELEGRR